MIRKKRLKIFLATVGEPIPNDSSSTRLHKTGQISEWLSEKGHEVIFFNGSFDHQNRKQRYNYTKTLIINKNYKVVLLWGREYSKSISLRRFLNHMDVARSFKRWYNENNEIPDIIICSYPIEELCKVFISHYRKLNVPIIIDCRDLWPDIFSEIFPKKIRLLSKIFFYPFEVKARKILSKATAISGMTKSFRDWGLLKARRKESSIDFIYPFTYLNKGLHKKKRLNTKSFTKENKLQICYLGTLTSRSNLELFIKATSLISLKNKLRFNLVIAGSGEESENLVNLAKSLDAPVEFTGYIDQNKIYDILNQSHLGLLTYSKKDFQLSIPNKVVEYLSAGLPIISCTKGEVEKLINENDCGIFVNEDINQIASIIGKLISNGINQNMYLSSVRTFENQFNKEKVFKKIENHLYKIIQKENNKL